MMLANILFKWRRKKRCFIENKQVFIKKIEVTLPLVDYAIPITAEDTLIDFAQVEIEIYEENV